MAVVHQDATGTPYSGLPVARYLGPDDDAELHADLVSLRVYPLGPYRVRPTFEPDPQSSRAYRGHSLNRFY